MLSQVIVRRAVGWGEKHNTVSIPLGSVVFVHSQKGDWSYVFFQENFYRVSTSNLEPLRDETEILSSSEIMKRNKKRSEERQKENEDMILNLKFE